MSACIWDRPSELSKGLTSSYGLAACMALFPPVGQPGASASSYLIPSSPPWLSVLGVAGVQLILLIAASMGLRFGFVTKLVLIILSLLLSSAYTAPFLFPFSFSPFLCPPKGESSFSGGCLCRTVLVRAVPPPHGMRMDKPLHIRGMQRNRYL